MRNKLRPVRDEQARKKAKRRDVQRATHPPDPPLGRVASILRGVAESKFVAHRNRQGS
jgi:hypothetical protein